MTDHSDEGTPLLSVTVLNYNYAHYLTQCLDSILSQTFTDFELILINDCSTDNSLDVIERFVKDSRVRLINHTSNQGYVKSLVEGVELSRGKYITVISADDFCVAPSAFDTLITALEKDSTVAFSYSAHGHYDHSGKRHLIRRPYECSYVRSGLEEIQDLIFECYVLHSGTIIRRSSYDAIGGYDASMRYAVDYKLWLMLCSVGNVAYSDQEIYGFRVHRSSMSHSLPSTKQSLLEAIECINVAISAMQSSLVSGEELRKRAVVSTLLSAPTYDIFNNRYMRGWYAYYVALREYPVETLFHRRIVSLILRTLLGGNVFDLCLQPLLRMKRSATSSAVKM